MDQDQVEIALNKLLPGILPEHVSEIAFDVRHTAPNEFTLHTAFVVDDEFWDSLDVINRAAFTHDVKMKLKSKIKAYTNINVVFDRDNTSMIKKSDWNK